MPQVVNRVNILNIAIDNLSSTELLDQLQEGGVVFTPNVDHLMRLQHDREFYQAYRSATYRICDSQVLMYAARWLDRPLQEKLSGSDFFAQFYTHYAYDESVTMFLLGAAPGVACVARDRINAKVGRNMAIAAHSPSYGFEANDVECKAIVDAINRSKATVLAVGVGSPKQELWIAKYRSQLKHIRIVFAIGATLDFEAGHKQRSPQWFSHTGLEWLFRLVSEPRRLWKRYLVDDLPFVWLALQQKLGRYRAPILSALATVWPGSELDSVSTPAVPSSQRNTSTSRYLQPIGQLMQQAGILSSEQVQSVLQEQHQHPERLFGEIVRQQGWAKPETIAFFLRSRHISNNRLTKQQRLGDFLTEAALLSEKQLLTLLSEQTTSGLRLGEQAIGRGWLQPQTVDWFLQLMKAPTTNMATTQLHSTSQPSTTQIEPISFCLN